MIRTSIYKTASEKGCAYFLEKIETYCLPLIEASDVEIDNKEARKAFTSALKSFQR